MADAASGGGPRADSPMAQLPLETERLLLRPWRQADCGAVTRLLDDPQMAEFLMVIPQPFVPFDAQTLIRAAWRRLTTGRGFDLAIALTDSPDAPIGSAGIGLSGTDRRAELGFWIGREYWGRGYATEAARALMDFARKSLRIGDFTATAAEDNAASIAVLRKLGFSEAGRGTKVVPSTGKTRGIIHFACEASEKTR